MNDPTSLVLAQCLLAEAQTGSKIEKAAIAHILLKRWKTISLNKPRIGFRAVIRQYCSIFKIKNPNARQKWILNLKWHRMPTKHAQDWLDVKDIVKAVEAGALQDPLPSSIHFGNRQDHITRVKTGMLGRVRRLPKELEDPETGNTVVLQNYFYERS